MKNYILNQTAGIDTDAIMAIIEPYANGFYTLYISALGVVLLVVIGKDVYKYYGTDEDERESKALFKKIATKIGVGVFLVFLPTIIAAFGI